jgi:hypothetical protein
MNECSENYRWNVFDVYGNILVLKVILKRYEQIKMLNLQDYNQNLNVYLMVV